MFLMFLLSRTDVIDSISCKTLPCFFTISFILSGETDKIMQTAMKSDDLINIWIYHSNAAVRRINVFMLAGRCAIAFLCLFYKNCKVSYGAISPPRCVILPSHWLLKHAFHIWRVLATPPVTDLANGILTANTTMISQH